MLGRVLIAFVRIPTWRYRLALWLLEHRRLNDGLIVLDALIKQVGQYPELLYTRGTALYHLKRFDEAQQAYGHALMLVPTGSYPLWGAGNAAARTNDLDSALLFFNQALARDSRNPAIRLNRAAILGQLGRVEDAISELRALRLEYPASDTALYNLATLLTRHGDHQDAEQVYTELIALSPEDGGAFNGRGNARARQQRYTEALADFSQAIALNPRYGRAHFNRGCALRRMGSESEAQEAFRQAAALGFKGEAPGLSYSVATSMLRREPKPPNPSLQRTRLRSPLNSISLGGSSHDICRLALLISQVGD